MNTRSLTLFDHEIRAALRGELRLVVRPVAKNLVAQFDEPRGPEDVAAGYPMVEDRYGDFHPATTFCPLGVPGTRLVCKEAFASLDDDYKVVPRPYGIKGGPWGNIAYQADQIDPKGDGPANPIRWRSPATMPAWASRITLEVVSVGVCRVQEVTEEAAERTGIERRTIDGKMYFKNYRSECWTLDPTGSFRTFWNARYAAKGLGWDKSPWCWKVAVKGVGT